MILVTKRFTFEACHNLPYYEGACHNLHGHSYKMTVTVRGDIITDEKNPKCGMIVDFKDLKKIVKTEIIDRLDHSNLNDYFICPTAENMVKNIAEQLKRKMPEGVILHNVKLWETEDSFAEWSEFNVN